MRPSAAALVRVLARSAVPKSARVIVSANAAPPVTRSPTLADELLARQKAAPEKFPTNLRIEQLPSHDEWKRVQRDIRKRLKNVLEQRTTK